MKAKIFAPFLLSLLFATGLNSHASGLGPCEGQGSAILVNTNQHLLWICQDGRDIEKFRLSIGRGGIDKRKQGDNKTPIGEYALGEPKASALFGTFIPIGYPTAEQKVKGYSGNNVGLHGPSFFFKWLGRINTWFDWTAGCIAVGSENEINRIAKWVKEHPGCRIFIR